MTEEFRKGDVVECIDAVFANRRLKEGRHYNVVRLAQSGGRVEVSEFPDVLFYTTRFKKVENTMASIELDEKTLIAAVEKLGYTVTKKELAPRVGYVNVFPDGTGFMQTGTAYRTRKEADGACSYPVRLACIKVTEGQFDD